MFGFCFFRAFSPIFHFKLCSFCKWQQYFLPPGAGYPSYATGGGKDLEKMGKSEILLALILTIEEELSN